MISLDPVSDVTHGYLEMRIYGEKCSTNFYVNTAKELIMSLDKTSFNL